MRFGINPTIQTTGRPTDMAITAHDIVPDSPTNNFATMSPLWEGYSSSYPQSNGNLTAVTPTNAPYRHYGSMAIPNTGKWYFEIRIDSGNLFFSGIVNDQRADTYYFYYQDGTDYLTVNGSATYDNSYPYPTGAGSIIGFCIDLENSNGKIYINNTLRFDKDISALTAIKGNYFPSIQDGGSPEGTTQTINFGQDPTFGGATGLPTAPSGSPFTDANGIGSFYYQPPTGALALCTANLPDPDIDPNADDLPEDYFKAVKYTGQTNAGAYNNGAVTVGFQPDLVWLKNRDLTETYHQLYDSIRGSAKVIFTNDTLEEYNRTDGLTNFNSNGFSLGTHSHNNNNGSKFIAWCFRAGGAPDLTSSPTKPFAKDNAQYETLSAAGITAGTITPTAMSVNTKAGFSIVKYSGNGSIPHGLSSPLDLLIVKVLNLDGESWGVWHSSFSSGDYIYLNSPNQKYNNSSKFSGVPSSTVFQVGSDNTTGNSSYNYIAYCWHSVAGYSAFGSYEGSTAFPFVYTGFKPSFLLLKNADASSTSWVIHDNARDAHNEVENVLVANGSSIETTPSTTGVDFLSNGFKMRGGSTWYGNYSSSTQTVIYAAFAEQPFKYANAR